MKQASLLLNVALLIAVAVLYYLHFSAGSGLKPAMARTVKSSNRPATADSGASRIAYIDLDSLNEKIEFISKNRKALEAEQQAIENAWENGYRNLENQKNSFLKRGNAITEAEAEEFQATLLQQQQQIDNRKQTQTQQLNDKSYKFLEGIQNKLRDFLKEYNADGRYSYILSTGNGLEYLLYKDSGNDITRDVIEGMNEILNRDEKK